MSTHPLDGFDEDTVTGYQPKASKPTSKTRQPPQRPLCTS